MKWFLRLSPFLALKAKYHSVNKLYRKILGTEIVWLSIRRLSPFLAFEDK